MISGCSDITNTLNESLWSDCFLVTLHGRPEGKQTLNQGTSRAACRLVVGSDVLRTLFEFTCSSGHDGTESQSLQNASVPGGRCSFQGFSLAAQSYVNIMIIPAEKYRSTSSAQIWRHNKRCWISGHYVFSANKIPALTLFPWGRSLSTNRHRYMHRGR